MSEPPVRKLLDRPSVVAHPAFPRMSRAVFDTAENEQRAHPERNRDLTLELLGRLAEVTTIVAIVMIAEERERWARDAAAHELAKDGGVH